MSDQDPGKPELTEDELREVLSVLRDVPGQTDEHYARLWEDLQTALANDEKPAPEREIVIARPELIRFLPPRTGS